MPNIQGFKEIKRAPKTPEDAVFYQLEITPDAISKTASGVLSSASIVANSYKIVGGATRVAYAGRLKIYWDSTLKYTSSANESSKTYNASNTIKTIKVELYEAGGTTTLLASTSVLVISEGQQGLPGIAGAMLRTRGKHSIGSTYYNSENYIDVVMNSSGSFFKCKVTHDATSANIPTASGNTYWEPFNEFQNVATDVLLANKGSIDSLGASIIFVGEMDSNGNRAKGWVMTNGEIYYISNGKQGLTLGSNGKLIFPDGLDIQVGQQALDNYLEAKTQNQINNIEIGGVNLLNGTSEPCVRLSTDTTNNTQKIYNSWSNELLNTLKNHEQFTMSADFDVTKVTDYMIAYIEIYYKYYTSTNTNIQSSYERIIKTDTFNGYVKLTTKIPSDRIVTEISYATATVGRWNQPHNTYGSIKNFKIEKGNKATAWSPSQADIDSSIKNVSDKLTNMEIGGENLASGADTIKASNNTVYLRLLDKPKIVRMLNASGQFVLSAFISSDSGYGTASITLKYSDGTSGTFSLTETAGFRSRSHRVFSLNKTVADIGDFYLQGSYTTVYQPQLEAGNKLTAYKSPNDNIYLDGKNLFSQNKCTEGKYLTYTGAEFVNASWGYSDYIDVSKCSCLIASGYTNLGSAPSCVFYDSSKKMTRALTNNGTSVNKNIYPNATEAYIRFSFQLSDIKTLKIEKGSVATEYVENEYDLIPNLFATGIDIRGKRMIATVDKFLFRSNSGTEMAVFEEVDGKGRLKTDMIDADALSVGSVKYKFNTASGMGDEYSTGAYTVTANSPNNIDGINTTITLSCTEDCVGKVVTIFNKTEDPRQKTETELGKCTFLFCENGFNNSIPDIAFSPLNDRYTDYGYPQTIHFFAGVCQLCCIKEKNLMYNANDELVWTDIIRWTVLTRAYKTVESLYQKPKGSRYSYVSNSINNVVVTTNTHAILQNCNDYYTVESSNIYVYLPSQKVEGKVIKIISTGATTRIYPGSGTTLYPTSGTAPAYVTIAAGKVIEFIRNGDVWIYYQLN